MTRGSCPSPDRLRDYLLGCVSETELAVITEHLAVCAACEATAAKFDGTADSVVQSLRSPADVDPYPLEPQCRQAAAELYSLVPAGAACQRTEPDSLLTEPGELRSLGPYRLLHKLGQGGMGTVYQAVHIKLDKVVALKILFSDRLRDAEAVARFEREMKAVGRLSHANIVQAFDAGESDGIPFLVMEYVEGVNASDLVQRGGPLGVAEACEIVRQAALGLQCAHDHGLIHRDVKPSNLMVTLGGQVKLLDLGLALFRTDLPCGEEITTAGSAMGTVDYMAPEQVTDSHRVDAQADLYSLGCTLYKLLAGQPPFGAPRYQSVTEKMLAQVHDPAPPLRERRPDVPPALSRLVERLLAKTPNERPTCAREVAETLQPLAQGSDLAGVVRRGESPVSSADGGQQTRTPTDEFRSSFAMETHRRASPSAKPAGPTAWSRRHVLGGAAAVLLAAMCVLAAAQIIITVRNRGQKTEVSVSAAGDVEIRVPSTGRAAEAGASLPARLGSGRPRPSPVAAGSLRGEDDALRQQRRCAEQLRRPLEETNSIGLQLVLVPAGEFTMGTSGEDVQKIMDEAQRETTNEYFFKQIPTETPAHRVTIPQAFYMGKHEVTVAQFRQFVEASGYVTEAEKNGQGGGFIDSGKIEWQWAADHNWRSPGFPQEPDHPVVAIGWRDAVAFCQWLSEKEGQSYRLPTEEEWEYACRAGTTTRWNCGDGPALVPSVANFADESFAVQNPGYSARQWNDGYAFTAPAGKLEPNAFGLHDMHGNAREWCADAFLANAYARKVAGETLSEAGHARARRVIRGGDWLCSFLFHLRSAARMHEAPQACKYTDGFRVVRTLPP